MKEILLTQGKVAKVDDENFQELNQDKWHAWKDNKSGNYYARRTRKDRLTILMSRQIMDTPPSMICDHRNGDTLDNQRHNLRNCTATQNQQNRKGISKRSTTGILGVTRNLSKYMSYISESLTGKKVYLGSFDTIEEAAKVRRDAERLFYGEFSHSSSEGDEHT